METFEEYYKLDGSEAVEYIDLLKGNFDQMDKGMDWLSHVIKDVCDLVSKKESLEEYTKERMGKTIEQIGEEGDNKFTALATSQQLLLYDIISTYYNMTKKYQDIFANEYVRVGCIAQACYDIDTAQDEESMFKVLINVFNTITNIQDRLFIIKWLKAVYICHNDGIGSEEHVSALNDRCQKVIKIILDNAPRAVLPPM